MACNNNFPRAMKKTNTLCIAALLMLCSRAVLAQDLSGDWQGALSIGTQQLRLILHIDKADDASWKATLASIDQSPDRGARMPADAVTVAGTSFKMTVAAIRGSFDGTIASDGNSIVGTWTQGAPLPLTLTRATPATAWKDPSPHTASFVTSERDVKLEVLDWGGPSTGRTLVLVPGLGNTAHIFEVTPRKKRQGLFKGDLWIDAKTFLRVQESGYLVKNPSVFLKKIAFVRKYEIHDGISVPRQVQSVVDTRLVGKAELTIDFSHFALDASKGAAGESENQ